MSNFSKYLYFFLILFCTVFQFIEFKYFNKNQNKFQTSTETLSMLYSLKG